MCFLLKIQKMCIRDRDYIVDQGYDPIYGARPLKRYLQSQVETLIARLIIGGGLKPKDELLVDCEGGKLTVRVNS